MLFRLSSEGRDLLSGPGIYDGLGFFHLLLRSWLDGATLETGGP